MAKTSVDFSLEGDTLTMHVNNTNLTFTQSLDDVVEVIEFLGEHFSEPQHERICRAIGMITKEEYDKETEEEAKS